jgi:hypothetical protein
MNLLTIDSTTPKEIRLKAQKILLEYSFKIVSGKEEEGKAYYSLMKTATAPMGKYVRAMIAIEKMGYTPEFIEETDTYITYALPNRGRL